MKKKFLVVLVMAMALCLGCSGLAWAAEETQPGNEQTETRQQENQTQPTEETQNTEQKPITEPEKQHSTEEQEKSNENVAETCTHQWKIHTVDATCEAEGHTYETCQLCGEEKIIRTIPQYEHRWSSYLESATCTKGGRAYRRCLLCRIEETTSTSEALGHNYYDSVKVGATELADGYIRHKCSRCGDEYTEILPRLGGGNVAANQNGQNNQMQQPTQTVKPEHKYVIPDANKVYSVNEAMRLLDDYPEDCPGEANGWHLWTGRITTIPTLTETGVFSYNCKGCSLKFDFKLAKSVSLYQIQGWAENNPTATNIEEVRALLAQNNVQNNNQQQQQQQQQQQNVEQQPAQTNSSGQSGSLRMSKLSQAEIKQLLANAPKTDFSDTELYAAKPAYTAPYAAGRLNQAPLQATLARLNALRRLAGLPAVTLDNSMTEYAQQAALISAVYGTLNHHPAKPADMNDSFYQGAYKGTSSSNLSAGRVFTATPDGWMDDSDASNIDRLGHRRWQLNPNMGKIGFGYVTTDSGYKRYAAEWSFDNTGGGFDYDFVAWPASGNFPADVFGANIAWSVSVNPSKYQTPSQNGITVTLTRESDGQQWTFSGRGYNAASSGSYFNVETTNYGVPNCIIFRPDNISSYNGVYTVKIDGLRTSSGQQTSLQYQVDFFSVGENTTVQNQPSQPNKENNNQQQNNNNTNNVNNNKNNNTNNNVNNTGNNRPNNGGTKKFDPQNAVNPFNDVHDGDYFRDTVLWAVQRGVTKGTTPTTFEPYTKCSNADILTMLWRLYSGEEIAGRNPFSNVSSSDYYYQPALWAYQLGMVTDKNFDWSAPCTRGTTMRFIWIAAEKIQYSGSIPFNDVSNEFKMPVAWAWSAGIAKGTTDNTFEPNATCTRAEIATFLYRAFGGTLK